MKITPNLLNDFYVYGIASIKAAAEMLVGLC